MLHLELIYEWMCDMSSRIDAIDNNKSIVRFRWFVIILQDRFLALEDWTVNMIQILHITILS